MSTFFDKGKAEKDKIYVHDVCVHCGDVVKRT